MNFGTTLTIIWGCLPELRPCCYGVCLFCFALQICIYGPKVVWVHFRSASKDPGSNAASPKSKSGVQRVSEVALYISCVLYFACVQYLFFVTVFLLGHILCITLHQQRSEVRWKTSYTGIPLNIWRMRSYLSSSCIYQHGGWATIEKKQEISTHDM